MPLATLGLWGDGDEVSAIEDAFKAIGVGLPVEDAPRWITVGDLWRSVERQSPSIAANPANWDDFREALADETGVDWRQVDQNTMLLDGRGHSLLSRLLNTIKERLR